MEIGYLVFNIHDIAVRVSIVFCSLCAWFVTISDDLDWGQHRSAG